MPQVAPILIVDDSEDDVELFCLGLSGLNLPHPVDVCRDGEEALDYLLRRGRHAGRPDLLPLFMLVDVKMPRMGGIELLSEMRGNPMLRHLPVIVMTSSNQPRDVQASYAAGANGFVVKPVDFDKLVENARAIGTYWALCNRPPVHGTA